MKKLIIFVFFIAFFSSSFAQKIIKLKPNAAYGEDVELVNFFGCKSSIYPAPPETLNHGTSVEINYAMWTYSALGCGSGVQRTLIRFKGLDTISAITPILSAKLNFFGVPSSGNWGTSYFSGSPYPLTNEGWVERVTGGWSESIVTWNTQPTTTTTNRVTISPSAARFGWNTSVDVTTLINDIKTSGVNNGFLLRLNTEGIYRRVTFASSDNTDSTLWPELVITYLDDPCAGTKADFKDSSTSCYAFQFSDLSVTDDASIASWSWDFGDLSSSTSKNPSHTYADYGTYNVRLIIHSSSGCIDTISKSITVKYKHFASAGMDTTLCLNNGSATAFLRGNGGISYDWTPTKNLSHPNAKNTYATVANSTPFYLSVVDSFGCKDRDTVNVNVFPKMNLRNSPKDTSVCMGTTIRLNASGAKSYQWTPPTGLDFPMLKNPSLTVTSPKTLIVTATDANGCIAFDTVNIKLNPDAQINITPKNPIACEGDSIAFSASGGVAYKWYPADGLSNDSIANPKHYTKGVAKYLVKGLNAAGCEGMDSVIINQYPNPIVEASSLANGNIVTCKGASIRLDASGASNYDWSPAEFCLNPSASSTEVFPTQTTVFTVIGTDQNGCQASDTISVIYDGKEKVFVPSSFTPNDDGINDRIGIVDQCNIQFLSIDIFNRWGQNIYSGYNLNDKWDGTANGKTCEMGTYFYLIKARTLTGEPINFKGDITLIR
jgi:gliding motility-associated-like protein